MKKQRFKINVPFWKSMLPVLLTAFILTGLKAQEQVTQRVTEMNIPANATSVYLRLKGGDGGNATAGTCKAYGGAGAITKAVFLIGDGDDKIPKGATLRLIRGENGGSKTGTTWAGGGGGGGSAVLYRKAGSSSEDDWKILTVAGGGGGAYSGVVAWVCTDIDDGKGGSATTSGGSGKVQSDTDVDGGTDGEGGYAYNKMSAGSGAGAYGSGTPVNSEGERAQQGYPKGGNGAHCPGCQSGGFGFGGGGYAFYAPGGGGGYSGGSAGSIGDAGGGGSFIESIADAYKIVAGDKGGGKKAVGYVEYEFNPGEELISDLIDRSIQFATNTSKCLNNAGGSTANGTNIQTNDCDGDEKEKWIFDSDLQSLRLQNVENKCINLPGASTSNGNNIELKDCNNSWGQRWYYNAVYKSLHTGVDLDKCMFVHNGITASGANNNIQIYDCQYGNAPQQWEITQATSVDDPKAKLGFVPKSTTNLAIHSHTNTEVGSNIQLWTYSTTNTAMKWQFDGLKLRLNNRTDRCMDLKNGSTSNGTNVHLWECKDKNTQEWLFDGFTNTIRSGANPQKCLQVNGSYAKRANIELWDCNGSDKQKFLMK